MIYFYIKKVHRYYIHQLPPTTMSEDDPQKLLDKLSAEVIEHNDSLIKARASVQEAKDALMLAQQNMLSAADKLLQSNEVLNQLKIKLLNNAANHWKTKAESKPVVSRVLEQVDE